MRHTPRPSLRIVSTTPSPRRLVGPLAKSHRSVVPWLHLSQTVMSFPVRRGIIAGTVSGSDGSGSGWAGRFLHWAGLPERQRLASSQR